MKLALQQAIARFLQEDKVPPDTEQRFLADYIDLNGDGELDAVVILSGSYWCGRDGCTMLVFQGQGKTFSLVSCSTLIRPPLTVSESKTNGWRDLIVEVSGGATTPGNVALKFDGKVYPLNPSIRPSIPVDTPIKGTVLFPKGTVPQTMPSATTVTDVKI